jgi:hypothetical protein
MYLDDRESVLDLDCNVKMSLRSPPSSKLLPVAVTLSFVVDDLLDVDEKSLAVSVEYKMRMTWSDDRLAISKWAQGFSHLNSDHTIVEEELRKASATEL